MRSDWKDTAQTIPRAGRFDDESMQKMMELSWVILKSELFSSPLEVEVTVEVTDLCSSWTERELEREALWGACLGEESFYSARERFCAGITQKNLLSKETRLLAFWSLTEIDDVGPEPRPEATRGHPCGSSGGA